MAFDPDEYLAKYGLDTSRTAEENVESFREEGDAKPPASGFDPDAYLAKYEGKPIQAEEPVAPSATPATPPTRLGAVGRGLVQGLTLGFGDELAGAYGAFTAKPPEGGLSPTEISGFVAEQYRKSRDESRAAFKAAEQAYPKTSSTSEVAGGLLSLFIPGVAAEKLAVGGAKAAKTGATAVKAASKVKEAAAIGATAGLGTSEADLTKGEVGQAAVDTGIGAATGALMQKAGEKVLVPGLQAISKRVAPTLKKLGEKLAKESGLDALRYMEVPDKVLLEEIGVRRYPTEAAAKEAASGELSDIISKHNLLKLRGGPKATLQRIEDAAIANRKKFNPIIDEVDSALKSMYEKAQAVNPKMAQQQFDAEKQRAMLELQNIIVKELEEAQRGGRDTASIAKWASDYGKQVYDKVNDIKALNELKQNLRETLNQVDWGKASSDLSDKAAIIRKTYGFLMRRMEELGNIARTPQKDATGKVLKEGLGDELSALNREYNSLVVLKKAMDNKVGGTMGQTTSTLTPYRSVYPALAAGAAVFQQPLIAALLGTVYAAEKITGQRASDIGRIASSKGLNALASVLQSQPGEVPQGLVSKLLRAASDPDNLSRAATMSAIMADKKNEETVQDAAKSTPKDVSVRVSPRIAPSTEQRGFVTTPSVADIERLKAVVPDDDNPQHIALRNILEEAKKRDQSGRNALLFALKQNPAYRQMLDQFTKEQETGNERAEKAQSR